MRMDPTAFRAQLLQNFRVRLGPGELGAVFTAFDKDKSMLIDGTEVRKALAEQCARYPLGCSSRRVGPGHLCDASRSSSVNPID